MDESVNEAYAYALFKLSSDIFIKKYNKPITIKKFREDFLRGQFSDVVAKSAVEMLILSGHLHRLYKFVCEDCKTINYVSELSEECGFCDASPPDNYTEMYFVRSDYEFKEDVVEGDYSLMSKFKRFFSFLF